ncbi:MAG: phage tail protein [Saprospiraceae bacterium]|nr:phage tail protein [Saprospiraceae bacterium]
MFNAKLKIEGKEFAILKCHYVLDRDTDLSGRPSTDIRAGKVTMQIESSSDTMFYDWVINAYAQKDGEIEFYKRNDPTPAKVLKFEEAYMVDYGEDFDVVGGNKEQPMVETFTVSARKLTLGGTFEKIWPE